MTLLRNENWGQDSSEDPDLGWVLDYLDKHEATTTLQGHGRVRESKLGGREG